MTHKLLGWARAASRQPPTPGRGHQTPRCRQPRAYGGLEEAVIKINASKADLNIFKGNATNFITHNM
jgi:hypothetical protein